MKDRSKRALLGLLAAASLVMLAVLVLWGEKGGEFFALLAVAFPVLLMALGAWRRGVGPTLSLVFVLLLILLEVSTVILLLLRGQVSEGPWVFGLPIAMWVQLVGFWLLPLLLVGLGYALTFDSRGLKEADLHRLRQRWGGPRDGA